MQQYWPLWEGSEELRHNPRIWELKISLILLSVTIDYPPTLSKFTYWLLTLIYQIMVQIRLFISPLFWHLYFHISWCTIIKIEELFYPIHLFWEILKNFCWKFDQLALWKDFLLINFSNFFSSVRLFNHVPLFDTSEYCYYRWAHFVVLI